MLFIRGFLSVLLWIFFTSPVLAMEFSHGGARSVCRDPDACKFWVEARGEFTQNADKDLVAFLKANRQFPYSVIRFHSGGGNVQATIRMGILLRDKQFDTETNFCASACLYAFLGGVKRSTVGENPRVGIHRFYRSQAASNPTVKQFTGVDMDSTQQLMAGLLFYAHRMGVDLRLIALSIDAGPSEMRWLEKGELELLRVTYEPDRWADWRLVTPPNSQGVIAISETQDKSKSMQLVCSQGRLLFSVIDEKGDSDWLRQCRDSRSSHRLFGVIIPSANVTVISKPTGIVFQLPQTGMRLMTPAIFSANDDYPAACTDSAGVYSGTTVDFQRMWKLVISNCID